MSNRRVCRVRYWRLAVSRPFCCVLLCPTGESAEWDTEDWRSPDRSVVCCYVQQASLQSEILKTGGQQTVLLCAVMSNRRVCRVRYWRLVVSRPASYLYVVRFWRGSSRNGFRRWLKASWVMCSTLYCLVFWHFHQWHSTRIYRVVHKKSGSLHFLSTTYILNISITYLQYIKHKSECSPFSVVTEVSRFGNCRIV